MSKLIFPDYLFKMYGTHKFVGKGSSNLILKKKQKSLLRNNNNKKITVIFNKTLILLKLFINLYTYS